ncbi:MAG: RNA polymerase sigma factor [Enhygromyxa sp.]
MRDDLQLLEAWREGDLGAGNDLLARHFESLHRFFASKVADEVEDLIQNTLLATVKYIDAVARASSFKAYLFTIASNQLYAHLRGKLRNGAHVDFTMRSAIELGLTPSEVVAKREREQQLSLALRKLPLELQIVLELSYWEELSASDIATVLDVPVGTAKSKIRRAKQLLAAELAALASQPTQLGADQIDDWVRQVRASIGE